VIAHRRTAFRIRGRWKYGGRIDKVISISHAAREQVLKAGIPADRAQVVYSGIEFSEALGRGAPEATDLRSQLGLNAGCILLAHAAAMTAEKRQNDLVEALKFCTSNTLQSQAPSPSDTLKAAGTPDVHLAIAGSGILSEELESLARNEGVANRVHFLGFRRDLKPLWAAADIAVFSSEIEGLCTALVEAQGAGLPAIVTRAGGMVEVVQDGVTGITIPVGDVRSMAGAIHRLSADAPLRTRLGNAARFHTRKRFSAEAMVDGTLAVYRAAREGAAG
jgi:glycosyltransferase involved in cell wall biosynthesis